LRISNFRAPKFIKNVFHWIAFLGWPLKTPFARLRKSADSFSTRNISGRKRKKIPAKETPIAVTERLQMAF
jgi:hypothetical protein